MRHQGACQTYDTPSHGSETVARRGQGSHSSPWVTLPGQGWFPTHEAWYLPPLQPPWQVQLLLSLPRLLAMDETLEAT